MSISELVTFDNRGNIERFPMFKKLFLPITIVLVAGLSFGIGRLSVVGKREAVKIEYDDALTSDNTQPVTNTATVINATQVVPAPRSTATQSGVVASKNGTKYHYAHCGGAKQIKEENKIVFQTPETAEAAGYTLAANCVPR